MTLSCYNIVKRRSLNKKAALIARTASHLPEKLVAQIEKTKLELDTLIKQDLERQRKKSRSLVLSVEQLLALLEAFEELCTDEDKWRRDPKAIDVGKGKMSLQGSGEGLQDGGSVNRGGGLRESAAEPSWYAVIG